jgi:hypothetical protein
MASNKQNGKSPHWSRYEVVINLVLAFLTLLALGAAIWSANEASKSVSESQESRFADNLPAFEIGSVSGTDGQPLLGLHIKNVGKGPGMLLAIGFTDRPKHSYSVSVPVPNRECVPPNCEYAFIGENFDVIAKQYAQAARLPPSTFEQLTLSSNVFGGQQKYFIQFADVFKNQYRQYFYYSGMDKKFAAYGRFETGPRGNDDPAIWPPPSPLSSSSK